MENGLDVFSEFLERSGAACVELERDHLAFQELVHQDLIRERAQDRVELLETEGRRERRDMDRMKAFMEFSMQAIVTAVKEVRKQAEESD